MPIQNVLIKRGGAYQDQTLVGPFIKIEGQYLVWDEPTVLIKADGAYSQGLGELPTNTVLPILTAPAGSDVGDTLVVTPGTWDGNPTPVITYRWYADGLPIIGELGPTLLITTLQAGHTITVEERATNTLGTVAAQAAASFDVPALTGFSSGFGPGFGA